MVERLPSYVADSWFTPNRDGDAVLDSSTGEPVATVSSEGIDFARMVEYARTVGGPELRRLTFRERAALIEALAGHLTENK